MSDATFTINDALRNCQDNDLREFLGRHWDLLVAALDAYYADHSNDLILANAIRRCRMEIIIGNRLE